MSRQRGRRGGRRSQGTNNRMRWLFLGGGAVIVAAAVIAIMAIALNQGVPGEGDHLDGGGHALGPDDAPVTLVEFSDFQ